MEYVFGTRNQIEVLKTKGNRHSNLSGWHELERSYPDQIITDQFLVTKHLRSDKDAEGNCYDWYEISNHNRYTDKTGSIREALEVTRTELEDAMCEQDAVNEERIAAIEDALCEMDKEG